MMGGHQVQVWTLSHWLEIACVVLFVLGWGYLLVWPAFLAITSKRSPEYGKKNSGNGQKNAHDKAERDTQTTG